ncbi:hypothetical protein QEN19_001807 [Hanseniaspora menglaensis]
MSLLIKFINRAVDSGLIIKLLKKLPFISRLLVVAAIALIFGYLPLDGSFRRTYISENALMPNQAYSQFRETEWNIVRGFRNEIKDLKVWNIDIRNKIVSNWLQDYSLETSIYKTNIISDVSGDHNSEVLYGILNGQRCDGTEAMVICAPWFNSEMEYNVGGVSVAIALTRFFTNWPIWSKNIILVIPETPGVDLRKWVESYHNELKLTGGTIESAMVLDYPSESDSFDYLDVEYIGLNGALPNLDLVNTALHIAENEGIKISINGMKSFEKDQNNFKNRLHHISNGIQKMAMAGLYPLKGHEAFSGWRIQAITLKAVGNSGNHDITTFGRVPEAVTRSVNNLLEKFHQSFFFYLLLSPKLFVSIASYLPAAILVTVAFAGMSIDSLTKTNILKNDAVETFDFEIIVALVFYLISIALSLSYSKIINLLRNKNLNFDQQGKFLLIIQVFFLFTSYMIYKPTKKTYHMLKSIAFMHLSLVLTLLLALNFGLAFIMGVLAFPMTFIDFEKENKTKQRLLLLVSNPFIAIFCMCSWIEDKWTWTIFNVMSSSWENLGCWTWPIVCCSWLTTWILLVIASGYSPSNEKKRM